MAGFRLGSSANPLRAQGASASTRASGNPTLPFSYQCVALLFALVPYQTNLKPTKERNYYVKLDYYVLDRGLNRSAIGVRRHRRNRCWHRENIVHYLPGHVPGLDHRRPQARLIPPISVPQDAGLPGWQSGNS